MWVYVACFERNNAILLSAYKIKLAGWEFFRIFAITFTVAFLLVKRTGNVKDKENL